VVYPNPAGSRIYISLPASFKTQPLNSAIFTLSGRLVKTAKLQPDDKVSLDCSDLQNGYYIIRLQNADSVLHTRFLIQKQ